MDAKKIAIYGARGQLGNMLWLTNLRFDFVLLGALAGPAVLGIYAVASKFAELMRLAPTAINYVLYPRLAKLGLERATTEGRRLLPQATALTLLLTPLVAVIAYVGPALIYGSAFRGAVVPAEVIILGLSIEGAAAVSSAYLLGVGQPGLNSIGMGVGATITVTLDLILIPKYGALGGAITSAVTYATTTAHAHVHRLPGGAQGAPFPVRVGRSVMATIRTVAAVPSRHTHQAKGRRLFGLRRAAGRVSRIDRDCGRRQGHEPGSGAVQADQGGPVGPVVHHVQVPIDD